MRPCVPASPRLVPAREYRWVKLAAALDGCGNELSLANADTEGPTAWLQAPPGTNATALIASARVVGVQGVRFGSDASHIRLNL